MFWRYFADSFGSVVESAHRHDLRKSQTFNFYRELLEMLDRRCGRQQTGRCHDHSGRADGRIPFSTKFTLSFEVEKCRATSAEQPDMSQGFLCQSENPGFDMLPFDRQFEARREIQGPPGSYRESNPKELG